MSLKCLLSSRGYSPSCACVICQGQTHALKKCKPLRANSCETNLVLSFLRTPIHHRYAFPTSSAHLLPSMRTGRSTIWTLLAAWQAVRGASPVIITSWWLASLSMRRAGSLSGFSGHCSTAKPAKLRPDSASSRVVSRSWAAVKSPGSRLCAKAMTLHLR